MCLAIPLKIRTVNDTRGVVEIGKGAEAEVDLTLVPGATVGDYVLVHAGFAIKLLDSDEANERLKLFSQVAGTGEI